jgi:hypothetical protein
MTTAPNHALATSAIAHRLIDAGGTAPKLTLNRKPDEK